MKDEHKTKGQLISELRSLRRQLARQKRVAGKSRARNTPKKLAENQITQQEERYRLLFELSPAGIILEDSTGTILDVNPAFCKMLGYKSKELIGEKVHILAHPDVRKEVDANISKLLSGKKLKHNEKSVRKDGTISYMELSETKVKLPNDESGILCIAEDFTERVKAQEERIEREKLHSVLEMAGAVCHELNQPLTTIFITSDLLIDFPNEENLHTNITVIKNEAMRIGRITNKLMKITRYETREYVDGSKIFDINKASGQPE
jgi:PAS domain S-box-containing protein